MWGSSIMGLEKLILLDGRNRPGGNMTTVSVIVILTAGGMSITRVRVNVYQMGKGPHLEVRAQYSLADRTNVTNT